MGWGEEVGEVVWSQGERVKCLVFVCGFIQSFLSLHMFGARFLLFSVTFIPFSSIQEVRMSFIYQT